MDFNEKDQVESPEIRANFLSKYFFFWIVPLLKKGSKKDLTINDLYDRLDEDDAAYLGDRMERLWEQECQKAKMNGKIPSFLRTAIRFFGTKFFLMTFYILVNELSQPFILRAMIRSFQEEGPDSQQDQYLYTSLLVACTLVYGMNSHQIFMGLQHISMKGKIAGQSLIYRRIFNLTKTVQSESANIGKLVNLIGSDVNRFDHCFFHLNWILVGPIQLIILTYFLYVELGPASLAGVGIIGGILIPFQLVVGRFSAKFRTQVAKRTDERGRMLNEIIMGIRIVKMYAWEIPFSTVINNMRMFEMQPVKKSNYLRATFQSLNTLGRQSIPFCTFILFVYLGNELTAEKAYFSISVYSILIAAMAQRIPLAAAQSAELLVATRRIRDFLQLEEICKDRHRQFKSNLPKELSKTSISTITTDQVEKDSDAAGPKILLENVCASWIEDKPTLQNISLNLSGNVFAIAVGPVGCGKSSLLNLLVSELPKSSGSMTVQGRISYCSQESWIFSGSIRQNILLGCIYDKTRYDQIIRACALEQDLAQLGLGDMTIVGERGVALSGGQKARVNLARALYRKANIYLMDDPLSAVDAKVSRQLFEECIMGSHLAGSLRVLVTHQLQYLPQADHIIVFNENGEITAQGSYDDLVAKKVDFVCMMNQDNIEDKYLSDDTSSDSLSSDVMDEDEKRINFASNTEIKNEHKVENQEEMNASGSVKWRTYFAYITSGNSKVEMVVVISLFLLAQCALSFTEKWISLWTNEVSHNSRGKNADHHYTNDTYISVYSCCVMGSFVFILTKSYTYFHYCMSISVNLHDKMFGSLVRAPVRFFDINSSGRILNRFTRDLNCVDENLPPTMYDMLNVFLQVSGILILVISTNYFLLLPSILLWFVLFKIRTFYVKSARDIKRIESTTKSPIFAHLSATVDGLSTIRGLQAEELLIEQFDSILNIHTSPAYLSIVGNRWAGVWMDLICVLFLSCVAASFIVFPSTAQSGNVGMLVTLSLNILAIAQWGMRQSADTENYMTSVERILQYCDIAPEAPLESKDVELKNWPTNGAIKFVNVSLIYDRTNKVLNNVSFDIKAKEKIGIVGRTGAGKSSLIVSLFRLEEPEGDIFIDDVPIKTLGLHSVRKNISIIPQDPVLFSGSMRYNLDPFDQFPDEILWKVLKEVNLSDSIPSLDYKVSDGGGNFSVGQRQLVCLARAILRNNKIIVMDEATANVDLTTDALVQREIRRRFAENSIITISHRLQTVIDSDRIIVMDNGSLKEFDTPANLLKNPSSLFSQMIGESMPQGNLRKLAFDGKINKPY